MLFVCYNDDCGCSREFIYQVDDDKSLADQIKGKVGRIDPMSVYEVQADGDELADIIKLVTKYSFEVPTLPLAYGKSTMRWFGDHARFIVYNL